jgi:putative transposase
MRDLKAIYQAPTLDKAEQALLTLSQKWTDKYSIAVKAWHKNWSELVTFFEFPYEIRRLIYTNNAIESYNRQLRKVTKNKGVFPSQDSICKLLYLAHRDIAQKWTMPLPNWAKILNQLAIYFEGRVILV